MLIFIEMTLLDQGVHTCRATVRETLKTHQVVTSVLPTADDRELHICGGSTAEPAPQVLYGKLGAPGETLRPQRRWVAV